MSVSQIVSYKPAKAVVALVVAGFICQFASDGKNPHQKWQRQIQLLLVAAPQSVKLTDIVVQGLQRSDPSTVFGFLPVKVGDIFNAGQQDIIKALYASGLYEDVKCRFERLSAVGG